jgi:molybdenum cofactor biosynthesis enzyme MoaA
MYLDTQEGSTKLPDPYERVIQLEAITNEQEDDEEDDGRQPSISVIQDAIQEQLLKKDYESIVIAGEGEPTLRWNALLTIAKRFAPEKDVRLTTNGMIAQQQRPLRESCLALKESGVKVISVALMTADPLQYNQLMDPLLPTADASRTAPHDMVCSFIREAIACQLDVELTGVDRPDVDKAQAEDLAASLGATSPMRWRTFFR